MARTAAKAKPTLTTAQKLSSLIKSARDIMRKDKGLNGDLDRLPQLTWIMFLKFLDDMERLGEEEAELGGTDFRPTIAAPYRWRDWAAGGQGITGDDLLAFVNQDEAMRPDGQRGPGLLAYLRGLQSGSGRDRRDVIANVFRGVTNRMVNGYLLRDVVNLVDGIHFTGLGRDPHVEPSLRVDAARAAGCRRRLGRVLHPAAGRALHGAGGRPAAGRDHAGPCRRDLWFWRRDLRASQAAGRHGGKAADPAGAVDLRAGGQAAAVPAGADESAAARGGVSEPRAGQLAGASS